MRKPNSTLATPITYQDGSLKFSKADNGCWEWLGFKDRNGYGMCGTTGTNEQYAHRAIYVYLKGSIPPGMTIDHLCRNRGCVNPSHLEPVSMKINVRRSPRTRLTPESIKDILSSELGLTALGKKYGVTKQAIYRVRKGLMWTD